jgi:NAD(P)-dependent dehydrogenase (short-subunit alcohol dehydrogenase family)
VAGVDAIVAALALHIQPAQPANHHVPAHAHSSTGRWPDRAHSIAVPSTIAATTINNAGILGNMIKAPSEDPIETINEVYEVNVFGAIRVTQAFIPLLKASKRANIVMVSSGFGSLTWLSNPTDSNYGFNLLGYSTSKNALNGVMLVFSKELAGTGIRVNAADPGYTDTDFNGHTGHRTVEQAAKGIVELATIDESGPTGGYFHDGSAVLW